MLPNWNTFVCEIYAAAKSKNVNFVCYFARGFSLCQVGDTHLNEIVLLFNGVVNYSAVKTSHDTHRNSFKFRARRSSDDNYAGYSSLFGVLSAFFLRAMWIAAHFLCVRRKMFYCCKVSTFDFVFPRWLRRLMMWLKFYFTLLSSINSFETEERNIFVTE
jgi:hypothetical protein